MSEPLSQGLIKSSRSKYQLKRKKKTLVTAKRGNTRQGMLSWAGRVNAKRAVWTANEGLNDALIGWTPIFLTANHARGPRYQGSPQESFRNIDWAGAGRWSAECRGMKRPSRGGTAAAPSTEGQSRRAQPYSDDPPHDLAVCLGRPPLRALPFSSQFICISV